MALEDKSASVFQNELGIVRKNTKFLGKYSSGIWESPKIIWKASVRGTDHLSCDNCASNLCREPDVSTRRYVLKSGSPGGTVPSALLWTRLHILQNYYFSLKELVGLRDFGVTYSPRYPRFAGSNPVEVDGFLQDVKILSTSPPGGTLSWGSRVWDFRLVEESQAWRNSPLSKI